MKGLIIKEARQEEEQPGEVADPQYSGAEAWMVVAKELEDLEDLKKSDNSPEFRDW